jgi:hypothetical protein
MEVHRGSSHPTRKRPPRLPSRVNGIYISKNVYAKTREEWEEKPAELIKTMKAEIAAEKQKAKQA